MANNVVDVKAWIRKYFIVILYFVIIILNIGPNHLTRKNCKLHKLIILIM